MSPRNIFILTAFCAVFLLGQTICAAQSKESDVLFDEPSQLTLKGDENAEREEESGTLLRETFYPIGWSKDGVFAYYVEPPDEACGCYFANLVIQDLRTDKILWERKYNSEGKPEDTLEKYWAKNQKEFSRKLAEYGIVAQKQFTLHDSAIRYQKDVFTPKLTDNSSTEDNFYIRGSVRLQLISKKKGRKTIYFRKFNPKKVEGFLGAELGGSLLSPFEARAAVIMIEVYRGWEGPPHTTEIRIVGADLTTGFK